MEINSLRELYVEQLRDLYDAETQLIKALPRMAKEATSDELRQEIEEHLEQTADTPSASRRYLRSWARKQKARSARVCRA